MPPVGTTAAVPLVWTVGSGGLLGSAVDSALMRAGYDVWRPARAVPWARASEASEVLREHQERFLASATGRAWWVVWCAGASVTSSGQDALHAEVATFEQFLTSVAVAVAPHGSVVLASSAGGVYSGSQGPPFDEGTVPSPLAPYGQAKLAMERSLARWTTATGGRSLVCRIGNLFGPGQDMRKPQGLVSQLLRAHVTRQPLQVYVPLDTIRDYMYTGDAASRIIAAAARLQTLPTSASATKVIATQQGMTIGAVLGEMRRVLRRRPPIVLGASPVARLQARDLRLRSVVWKDLDAVPLTPFPVAVHRTLLDVERQLR